MYSLPFQRSFQLKWNFSNLSEIKVSIGNKEVERVSSTKSLNIIVNGNLQWKEHVDSGSKNISNAIGILGRFKPSVTQYALNTMYKSLVLSNFDYCWLAFGNCNKSDKVQKLQNRPPDS